MPMDLTLNNTLGIYLLATFAASVLFGITNLQVFLYYRVYSNDSTSLKLAVAMLWISDALILAFEFHVLYHYLILNFGDALAIAYPVWSLRAEGIASCIGLAFVESLYAMRVWKLYRPQRLKIIPLLVIICVVALWAAAINVAQKFYKQVSYDFSRDFKVSLAVGWSTVVVVETVTSAAICWRLYQPKRQFSCTDSIIRDIVLWVLGTGVLTCACSISLLAAFLRVSDLFVWISLAGILPKVATNGFLAMLNVRQSLRSTVAGNAFVLPKVQRASDGTVQAPLPVHLSQHIYADVIGIAAAKDQAAPGSDDGPKSWI